MIDPRKLHVLVSGRPAEVSPIAPLPTPEGCVYTPPNADGSRKICGNCTLWAQVDLRCLLHGPLQVDQDMVCGYHVYGEPQEHQDAITLTMQPLTTAQSGLGPVSGGVSCDTCRYFDHGKCIAIADPTTGRAPANVEALGCCARWTALT